MLLHDYTLAADGKGIDLVFSPTGIMGSESDFGVTLSPDLTRTWVWVAGPTKEREQIKIVYPPWVKGVPVQVIKSGGMMDFHANLALTGDEMSLTVTEGKSMSKEPFKFDPQNLQVSQNAVRGRHIRDGRGEGPPPGPPHRERAALRRGRPAAAVLRPWNAKKTI